MADESPGFAGSLVVQSLAETEALGGRIAACLSQGDTIALEGDLGAGKTTLARAILVALGVTEDVPSPTFTLVQEYETPRLTVRHYDLYRVANAREMGELGLDDALDEGAALIEWPERAPAWLPVDRLHVALSLADGARRARITGPARWAAAMMEADHV